MIELLLVTLLFTDPPRYAEGWKGIVPLVTNRSEVEKILGASIKPCENYCFYRSGDDEIFIRYASEPCSLENRWMVARGTVTEISVYLGNQPKLSKLKLDHRKFKKTEDPELHRYYSYENEEQGITYNVSDRGRVTGIHWIANADRHQRLRCSSKSAP